MTGRWSVPVGVPTLERGNESIRKKDNAMKIAYFDCFVVASGDMILGTLLDAGLDIETLRSEVAKLRLSGYELGVNKVAKKGIAGSQALVILHGEVPHGQSHGHGHDHGRSHPHEHESLPRPRSRPPS